MLASHTSITPSVYEAVGDEFRSRFKPAAGWAHSVLFAAELPEFRSLLPAEVQSDMKAFAEEQKANKKAKREAALARKKAKLALTPTMALGPTEVSEGAGGVQMEKEEGEGEGDGDGDGEENANSTRKSKSKSTRKSKSKSKSI